MNTKGSTQAYALSALAEALTYVDGMVDFSSFCWTFISFKNYSIKLTCIFTFFSSQEAVLSVPDIVVKLWGLLSSKGSFPKLFSTLRKLFNSSLQVLSHLFILFLNGLHVVVVSVQRSALEVLIVICHLCGDLRGFNLLHTAAKQDATEKGKGLLIKFMITTKFLHP
jgi:hypothetical protein